MKMPKNISIEYIAPCGIDCFTCYAHLRTKKPCPGCRSEGVGKTDRCRDCKIKACADQRGTRYCAQCEARPCDSIKGLEKRYRSVYGVDLMENGRCAGTGEGAALMERERKQWLCSCGGVINQHKKLCSQCGMEHKR